MYAAYGSDRWGRDVAKSYGLEGRLEMERRLDDIDEERIEEEDLIRRRCGHS